MAAGNYLYHCVAVRYRVSGDGLFHSELSSLDDVNSQVLTDVSLLPSTERYPNQLANFIEQRMKLEFYVDTEDAYFVLRQIQFFIKPVATGYPQ